MQADILHSLRVRAVLSAADLFLWSNIGLFHLIYKTVNHFIMQSKPSHLNEAHPSFWDHDIFAKMLVKRV